MSLDYVLITPARNEAALIENTLQSMIAQTILPKRWVIVSDGSTDGTDEIVRKYQPGREWLELVRLPELKERNFAAKVDAFNAGYDRVKPLSFDVIGNLDADITFGEDYIEYLLAKFETTPKLGVAGTHYIEGDFHSYRDSYINDPPRQRGDPALSSRVLRGNRWLCADQGRGDRLGRGDDSPHEGLDHLLIRR